jgi:hypothetical protein
MTMQDYRRPRDAEPEDSSWMSALRSEVEKNVRRELHELRQMVQTAMTNPVNVTSPEVNVAPAEVNVAAPRVTVEAPDVNVDLGEIGKRFASLERSMVELTRVLLLPVTRDVQRDQWGRIESMTETRG